MHTPFTRDPDAFWEKQADRLLWKKKWSRVSDWSFKKPVHIRWFEGGVLNVSENCIDRHLPKFAQKTALIWEPDHPDTPGRRLTFQELHDQVCKMAHVLRTNGVKKGDFVTLYMPMIPEAAIAMLACARLGAPHSVIFGGFSPESISDRINDCGSRFVITADHGWRGGKVIPLKQNVEAALKKTPSVSRVFVVKHSIPAPTAAPWNADRDLDLLAAMHSAPSDLAPEPMDAEDPLFILYTSGSTGKPKGVLHTTGGYLTYASYTHALVFDTHAESRPEDVYWCTADVGWITGHSYLVYGPLSNAVTSVVFEGVPNFPTVSRFWEVIDRHQVSIFYTAPTAIRALMREGNAPLQNSSRKTLRLLGSVGEPINPEAWNWYREAVGQGRCPIVDTWWQTETGGILISPLPDQPRPKAGSATQPLPHIWACLVDDQGRELIGETAGNLCLTHSWPGQMRTVLGDHARFEQTYFSTFEGKYFTGDGARRDADGDYWITGRVDDVLNVAGHRLGTAEIESALVGHASVAEAAVVGYPHEIKGQGVYAYVTLKSGVAPSDPLKIELKNWVRSEISPIATPDVIQWAPGLPKTRSGKIMRRILRKIAENQLESLGDTSTLADPSVVDALVRDRG